MEVATVLNISPSLQSLGFNKGSLTVEVARVLIQNLDDGCAPRKLTLSGTVFDHDDDDGEHVLLITQLISTKWTCLSVLDVSCNEFTYPAMGMLCEALAIHSSIKALVAKECKISGGPLGSFTTAWKCLLQEAKTLESISLDDTPLLGFEAKRNWEHLPENTTLRRLSLRRCFVSPRAWLELYQGLEYSCHRPQLTWDLQRQATGLVIQYNAIGTLHFGINLDDSDYDWVLKTVQKITLGRHEFEVSTSAGDGPLIRLLPLILACPKVHRLKWRASSREQAVPVLMQALPTASPSFSSMRVSWPVTEREEDEPMIDLEDKLSLNQTLLHVDLPPGTISSAIGISVLLRNKVHSLAHPMIPIGLLPLVLTKWVPGERAPAPPAPFQAFITEDYGKRLTATYQTIRLLSKTLLDDHLRAIVAREARQHLLETKEAEIAAITSQAVAKATRGRRIPNPVFGSPPPNGYGHRTFFPPSVQELVLLEEMEKISSQPRVISSHDSSLMLRRAGAEEALAGRAAMPRLKRQNGARIDKEIKRQEEVIKETRRFQAYRLKHHELLEHAMPKKFAGLFRAAMKS